MIDDAIYQEIGRIAVRSALLDSFLGVLASVLDGEDPVKEHDRRHPDTDVTKAARRAAAAGRVTEQLAEKVTTWLAGATAIREERHRVIHDVAFELVDVEFDPGPGYGRINPRDDFKITAVTANDLRGLVARLNEAQNGVGLLVAEALDQRADQ